MSPVAGLKRMFSSQALAELLKAILKATLVGWVTGLFLWHNWPDMMRLIAAPPVAALGDALHLIIFCGLVVVLGLSPMVGFDVFLPDNQPYQKVTYDQTRYTRRI